jgi:hypothetical protein
MENLLTRFTSFLILGSPFESQRQHYLLILSTSAADLLGGVHHLSLTRSRRPRDPSSHIRHRTIEEEKQQKKKEEEKLQKKTIGY